MVGHFHPPNIITNDLGFIKGHVIPDWMNDGSYVVINEDLSLSHKQAD